MPVPRLLSRRQLQSGSLEGFLGEVEFIPRSEGEVKMREGGREEVRGHCWFAGPRLGDPRGVPRAWLVTQRWEEDGQERCAHELDVGHLSRAPWGPTAGRGLQSGEMKIREETLERDEEAASLAWFGLGGKHTVIKQMIGTGQLLFVFFQDTNNFFFLAPPGKTIQVPEEEGG